VSDQKKEKLPNLTPEEIELIRKNYPLGEVLFQLYIILSKKEEEQEEVSKEKKKGKE